MTSRAGVSSVCSTEACVCDAAQAEAQRRPTPSLCLDPFGRAVADDWEDMTAELGVSTAVEMERMSSGARPLTKRPCHGRSRAYRTGEDTPDISTPVRVFKRPLLRSVPAGRKIVGALSPLADTGEDAVDAQAALARAMNGAASLAIVGCLGVGFFGSGLPAADRLR